ncbi:MAG TPA: hypothetical protein DCP20_00325 [Coriobacteriia bacterium]|nr:MAG: putative membrane protein [Actinobacteria bacterium 66_15]HAL29151.1 hypothetical protein [Coriobacteriia bacterium]
MRRLVAAFAVVGVIAAAAAIISTPGERAVSGIVIGAPDDTGGLIVHQMLESGALSGARSVGEVSGFELKDCCVSRAEWALSTDMLDAAVMCPDAAERLLERDRRFVIVGPCLVNSDVVVSADSTPTSIGIGQNRFYQEDIVRDLFGQRVDVMPVVMTGLPVAYRGGTVDGVVLDVLKARALKGRRWSSAPQNGDRITYVLVVSREFQQQSEYAAFMREFDAAAQTLNDPRALSSAVESYTGIALSQEEVEEWSRLRIRFVSTTHAPTG